MACGASEAPRADTKFRNAVADEQCSSDNRIEEYSIQSRKKNNTIVVSALRVRTGFGKLLRRVEDEHQSLVIQKRGTLRAVLLGIRDYVRLAAPEPEVLRIIGEESKRKGTHKMTSRQIDQEIKAARAAMRKRG